jgi:hypothetical protein
MKNLFRVALIKSATICHAELGKLLCQVLSATNSKAPKPPVVTNAEYFTSDQQLALHLHRSRSCVKKYRLKGYIPFDKEGNQILVKKSDVDKAVELYPLLMATSPLPSRPAPRLFIRIVQLNETKFFLHFSYQGEKVWIPVTPEEASNRSIVHTHCRDVIQLIHQIKPFKIAPAETNIAA